MFSRPKILFLVSLLFVALLNSIPTYLLNFYIYRVYNKYIEIKQLVTCMYGSLPLNVVTINGITLIEMVF